ncbi:hypothetical protein NE237_002925 [Protea cynaroides]|uniref:Thylakoid lumenal 15 kDa protein 1, chloroplastic n=1 Tax=Protea cynaroides TaxID=273540 RepID=A0A9Q0KGF1_9MAGN|nr:hypothetical protein NE237_002925 [Protea cynaroides]
MAILSVSPFIFTPKPLSPLSSIKSKLSRANYHFPCICSTNHTQREHFPGLKKLESPGNPLSSIGESLSRASLLALLSASLFLVDPALAFKGGGPYGSEVTRGQDLTGKDFSGKTLIKQDFKTSILRQANFKGAKLVGASFFDADLTGADLSDADLRSVDFSLANVTKANLSNANLEGALATGNTSFRGSTITGADFTDVPLRDDQREYLCKVADGVNPTTGNATRDTLFCG